MLNVAGDSYLEIANRSCFAYQMLLRFLSGFSLTSLMGNPDGKGGMSKIEGPIGPDGKKLKPCCACPESKKARDACIVENGEENCLDLIEAHKECMRRMGFNI